MARKFFSLDPKLARIRPTRRGHRNEIILTFLGCWALHNFYFSFLRPKTNLPIDRHTNWGPLTENIDCPRQRFMAARESHKN